MKFLKSLFLASLIIFSIIANAQTPAKKVNPLSVTYGISKTDYKVGDTITFIINLKIQDGWYVYSTDFAADGPMKFECEIEKNKDFAVIDSVRPYKPFAHYDDVWEGEVKIFENIAQFRLPVVVRKAGTINFKGSISGQVCSDLCVPFKEEINTDLSKLPFCDFKAADPSVYKHYENEGVKK